MGVSCIRTQKSQPRPIFLYQYMIKPIEDVPINKDFKIIEMIGQGSYAQVYKALQIKTNKYKAIKKIDRIKHYKIQPILLNQFELLKQLDHPNIVKVNNIYKETNYYNIVSQLCSGQELYQALYKKKHFQEEQACLIFFQLASAIMHSHQKHIMHRDIKPENMMYDPQTKILKIIDFGTAVKFKNSSKTQKRRVGTCYYIAPEVLQRQYNYKCDVWSAGVVLYVLLSGEPPFKGKNDNEILQKIKIGEFTFGSKIWKSISIEAKDLIKSMLNIVVNQRPQMFQIMKSLWIKKYLKKQQIDKGGYQNVQNCLENMNKFKDIKQKGIQSGMLIFIVNFINQGDDEYKMIKCFKQLDLNGDGQLSKQQLTMGLSKFLKINKKQAQIIAKNIFKKVDTNFSGYIDYSQFVISASNIELIVSEQNLDIAFDFMDKDKNGFLSASQIRSKLGQNFSEQTYINMLKQYQLNQQGQISKTDFIQMMKNITKNKS